MTPFRHTYQNEVKTLREWSCDPRCAVDHDTLQHRVKRGWMIDRALTQPYGIYGPTKKTSKSHCDIGPLTRGGAGRHKTHERFDLDVPTRVTNSSMTERYIPPRWEPVMSINRRV